MGHRVQAPRPRYGVGQMPRPGTLCVAKEQLCWVRSADSWYPRSGPLAMYASISIMNRSKAGQQARPAHRATSSGAAQSRRAGLLVALLSAVALLSPVAVACPVVPLWYETTATYGVTSA